MNIYIGVAFVPKIHKLWTEQKRQAYECGWVEYDLANHKSIQLKAVSS